jgi:hypothetical protein
MIMRARVNTVVTRTVFVVLSVAAPAALVALDQPSDALSMPAPTRQAPFAELTWVDLNEFAPSTGRRVYVRLIAMDGEIVLPASLGRPHGTNVD